jgi:RNA polymerase sigma factor for flagellar operon FliA
MIGLLDAAGHYTATKGANFETYAGIRIRGAMLDEVRRSDWTPRSVHRTAREVSEAVRRIENETGRDARPADIAAQLGLSLEEYFKAAQNAVTCRVFSFEQITSEEDESPADKLAHDGPGPVECLEEESFRDALAAVIDSLPQREKLVLSLYYDEELNLREIGEVLGVTESRVCQIHTQAVVRVRARLQERQVTV